MIELQYILLLVSFVLLIASVIFSPFFWLFVLAVYFFTRDPRKSKRA